MYDNDDIFESEMYYDREPASAAVDRLHGLGYGRDDISVMMDDKTREKAFSAVVNAKAAKALPPAPPSEAFLARSLRGSPPRAASPQSRARAALPPHWLSAP